MDSPSVSAYRAAQLHIAEELPDHAFRRLKFLCKDQLTVKEIEGIKDALGLFTILETKDIISEGNFTYIVKRLEDLEQRKLLKKVQEIMQGSKKSSTAPAPQPQSIAPKLEADQRGSVVNPISSKEETKELVPDTVPIESGESNASQCISKMVKTPEPVSESFSEGCSGVQVTEKMGEMSIVEQQGDQEAPPSQQTDPETTNSDVGQGLLVTQPSLLRYSMNHDPRGRCIIINNVNFEGSLKKKGTRLGSDEDADALAGLFKDLHFEVEKKKDQEATAMLELFESVSQSDHSDYDCFACCILTHGKLGEVYGADSETLEIQEILGLFTGDSCVSLAGKPKLFFIQACQGSKKQGGVLEADDPCGVAAGMPKTIPTEADFLLSCSTVSGYLSVRDTKKGTWYVNELVDQIKKYHKTTDMLNILTIVNNAMCDKVGKIKKKDGSVTTKQVPANTFTLKKALYL